MKRGEFGALRVVGWPIEDIGAPGWRRSPAKSSQTRAKTCEKRAHFRVFFAPNANIFVSLHFVVSGEWRAG
jgi:hypothetical protein